MPRFDYVKAAARERTAGHLRLAPGNGKVTEISALDLARAKNPDARACRRCEEPFWPTGEEPRLRPIHICPVCRQDVEGECAINGLPTALTDDRLTQALADIAALEGRAIRAERESSPISRQRALKLRCQVNTIRWELHQEATMREAAA